MAAIPNVYEVKAYTAYAWNMLTADRNSPRTIPRRKAAGPLRAITTDALAPFEWHWPAGHAVGTSPATSFAWLAAARMAFSETAELRVLAAQRDEDSLAAIALAAVRRGASWQWQPLGSELNMPADLAGRDPSAMRLVARELVRLGHPVEFSRMVADSPAIPAIRQAARGRALVVAASAEPEYYLELDESWPRPERRLAHAERRQYERALREAERHGSVSTEIHAPDLSELPRLLDRVFECAGVFESAGPASGAATATLARHLGEAVFFRHFGEAASMSGCLRIGLLRIGDRIAAAALAVEREDTLWLLRNVCAPRFDYCSAGKLLAREMLHYAAEAGVRQCIVWESQREWLRGWPYAQRPCVRLRVYPLGIAGLAAAVADGLVALWSKPRHSPCG